MSLHAQGHWRCIAIAVASTVHRCSEVTIKAICKIMQSFDGTPLSPHPAATRPRPWFARNNRSAEFTRKELTSSLFFSQNKQVKRSSKRCTFAIASRRRLDTKTTSGPDASGDNWAVAENGLKTAAYAPDLQHEHLVSSRSDDYSLSCRCFYQLTHSTSLCGHIQVL